MGMAMSAGLHALLLLLLAFMTTSPPEEQQVGFLEVEFGAFSEARPQPRAPELPVEKPEPEPEPEPEQEEVPPAAVPDEAKPVELPDAATDVPADDVVQEPDTDVIAPEEAQEEEVEEEPAEKPEPQPEVVRPLGSGSLTDDSDTSTGDEGAGTDETSAAPFQIEGLNRSPVATPLPVYAEQVNAEIRVRITVNPQGRIVQRIPLMKGNPALERAVMEALLTWQFNPLPPNAPQENQTGVISFRFRLR